MTRRHDLDWVRVLAFGLLVFYHVGMYYVSWDWHVKSPHAGPALEPFMFLTNPWRLNLLFMVSGAASAFLFARRPQGFLATRSWRLLVPLLFGMFVVVPPQTWYEVVGKYGYTGGFAPFYGLYVAGKLCRDGQCLITPTWNHLWFVAYLWVYTVVLWLLLKLAPRGVSAAGRGLERLLAGWGALLWPWLLLAVARLALVARFESTHALVDDWYNHAQYCSVFALGFLLARATAFWESLQRLRFVSLLLALASYACVVWYFCFADYGAARPVPEALRLTLRVVYALNQWSAIAAVFGFAYRLRDADSVALRYLVPAVFPVYILHQTVIIVLTRVLQPMNLNAVVEGALLVVLTFALCLAGHEIIRRVPPLRPLFGMKATNK